MCASFGVQMVMRGNMWSGSAFLVLGALACFPTGVEGGECSYSGYNVKAANMGACNTCKSSCSGTYCEYRLLVLLRRVLNARVLQNQVRRTSQMNRPQWNPAVWCPCVCRKSGACVWLVRCIVTVRL